MNENTKLKYHPIIYIFFPFILLSTTALILAGLGSILDSGEAEWEGLWKSLWFIGGYVFSILLFTKIEFFKSLANSKQNLGSNVWIAWLIALLTWPAVVIIGLALIRDTLGWTTFPDWYRPANFSLGMFVSILFGWWVFK